jgi:hypothetical protein
MYSALKKSVCLLSLCTFFGCGGSVEEKAAPAPASNEMSEEEQANYEKQMEMMREQQEKMRKN